MQGSIDLFGNTGGGEQDFDSVPKLQVVAGDKNLSKRGRKKMFSLPLHTHTPTPTDARGQATALQVNTIDQTKLEIDQNKKQMDTLVAKIKQRLKKKQWAGEDGEDPNKYSEWCEAEPTLPPVANPPAVQQSSSEQSDSLGTSSEDEEKLSEGEMSGQWGEDEGEGWKPWVQTPTSEQGKKS